MGDLRERASLAFDAKFRAKLADACQVVPELRGWRIVGGGIPVKTPPFLCCCPEGAVLALYHDGWSPRFPLPLDMCSVFPHTGHASFMRAFDGGHDDSTPEAALGLLYRARFS